jgi:hypothetical protein
MSMENLRLFDHAFLEKIFYSLLNFFSSFKNYLSNVLNIFIKSKQFDISKDCLFVFFLCIVPIIGLFVKDYVSDQLKIEKAQHTLEKSLISYAENHTQLFSQLRDKIFSEKLYDQGKELRHLFIDLDQLRAYSISSSLITLTGLRWVTANLKAIGPYGDVQNFNPKNFLPFLRSLDQIPGVVQITNIDNQLFLGMGIGEKKDIKGYLLMPMSLEAINSQFHFTKLSLLQITSNMKLPPPAITLDELLKEPFSFFKIHKNISWSLYFAENFVAYVIFFLFALSLLILKKKKESKTVNKLAQSQKRILSLNESLIAQQKTANIMVTRLHDGITSIHEISKLLLEAKTQSSSNVFNEKEYVNFVKKIYETSIALEKPIIKKKAHEPVDISETINQCLNFNSYKIDRDSIQIVKEYSSIKTSFTSDKESFYQLMLNLFHQALERIPEKGSVLIKMKESKGVKDCSYILTIEDNGYPFSQEELTSFREQKYSLFESYFDLEWKNILRLAQELKIKVSFENLAPLGNRITLHIYEYKVSKEEPSCGDNIIRLFPSS